MLNRVRACLSRLRSQSSGNATLMVALGIPALIGGSGMAVDLAQWYLWKREIQYAVDQAAVAGAFARSETSTQDTYQTRASQEFTANLSVTDSIVSNPSIVLGDYDGGTDNLVTVTANATAKLPFSSFLTGRSTTVRAEAQATFVSTATWTSCLIALDPSSGKAIWFNGGPDVNAGCGVAALSNASNAIEVSGGSGTLDLGWVIAAGGIDNYFDSIAGTTVVENATGLLDPWASVTVPDNPTARTLSCGSTSASYVANLQVDTVVTELYYEGPKRNELSLVSSTQVHTGTGTESGSVDSNAAVGDTTVNTQTVEGEIDNIGSGNNKTYFRTDVVTTTTREILSITSSGGGGGMMQPGTYSDFNLSCDTVLAPGIYVIDSGTLDVNAQYSLSGSGVMFVLKNGAGVKINGGASINLTAMTEAELLAEGLSAASAASLKGMLIIEDRASSGASNNKINGNASTYLNGTIYLPKSDVEILGTAGVTSQCLTIAAKKIKIGGTADLATFCPPGMTHTTPVATGATSVRLVG